MQANEIKVSIIIPIYNMEKYLGECLDTVIAQDLKEIEIICINDGSTDRSEEIVKEYRKKDSRIVLLSQENQGVASARNNGLKIATGKFVAFMDPDDWYPDTDVLSYLYEKAVETGVKICGGSFSEQVGEKLVTKFTGAKSKYRFEKDEIIKYLDYQFDYGYHRFIYELDFLKKNDIFFPLYIRFQDPPFFVKAMIYAGQFYAVKKITYRYRVGTQTIVWTERKLLDLLKGLRDLLRLSGQYGLKELHCLTLRRLCKNYVDRYAKILPGENGEVLKVLQEIEREIVPELIETDIELKNYVNIVHYFVSRGFEIQKKETEREELEKKIAELEQENLRLKDGFFNLEDTAKCPFVSVIIPVYKVEEYIEECVESVRKQSLTNIEIILVNDGTPDRSMEKVQKQIESDPRIKVVEKENGGLSSARNAGMKIATGEYVLFLDSDDLLECDALHSLYCEAKRNNLDDLFYNAISFYDDAESEKSFKSFANYYKRNGSYNEICSGQHMFIKFYDNSDFKPSACLQLLRREFLLERNIEFYEGILHEDNLFTFQILLHAKKVAFMDRPFYKRRVHAESIMTTKKGIRNAYGYFIGIQGILQEMEKCEAEIDSNFREVLGLHLGVVGRTAANFVQSAPAGEINEFMDTIPEKNRVPFRLIVLNVATVKKSLLSEKNAEKARKETVANLLKTVEQLKIQVKDYQTCRSYRIGRVITLIPRLIKKILNRA